METRAKYNIDTCFYNNKRKSICLVEEVFWSYKQNEWMYTLRHPLLFEEKGTPKFRRYPESKIDELCNKLPNSDMAVILYKGKGKNERE